MGKLIEGLKLPEPGKEVTVEDKPKGDPVARMEEEVLEELLKAQRIKNIKMLAREDTPAVAPPANPPPKTEEKVAINVAEMIKAIGEIMPKPSATSNDVLTKFLLDRQEKLEGILEGLRGGQVDPAEAVKQQLEIGKQIDDEFKRRATGLGVTGAASISELKVMLEIEQMKADREEKKMQYEVALRRLDHQHENDKAAQERRWKVEDEKWLQDFNLRKEQLGLDKDRTESAFNTFTNLATALVGSIDTRTGFGQKAPESPHHELEEVACGKCGQQVPLAPEVHQFKCPKCGTVNKEAE